MIQTLEHRLQTSDWGEVSLGSELQDYGFNSSPGTKCNST